MSQDNEGVVAAKQAASLLSHYWLTLFSGL
jgi:hypothetical protein